MIFLGEIVIMQDLTGKFCFRGRGSEWYNKCYGHICAQYLLKIRNSFQRMTEGPESKV